ncbi:hypothetical protein ACFQXB_06710 [Plastorhodobacter daqingensis]|uniref:Transposase n=1 Tax=Plastorhodobacter daqingensis TaxID=1387281 RepID=A0ABW2UIM1_9RHOB
MIGNIPGYYFRLRENGALVFRVESENRQRRLGMEPIAVANLRNGEIKPQGERKLTPEDNAAIRLWIEQRQAGQAQRECDDALRLADQMNQIAHWAQTRAKDAQLEAVSEHLLLAMHDLRSVLVRKKGDRLLRQGGLASEDAAQNAG